MVGLEAPLPQESVVVLHGCRLLEGSTGSDPFLGTSGLLMEKELQQWDTGSGPSGARLASTRGPLLQLS